jgi:hypothetical protein
MRLFTKHQNVTGHFYIATLGANGDNETMSLNPNLNKRVSGGVNMQKFDSEVLTANR